MNHIILIAFFFCKHIASKTDIQHSRAPGPPPKYTVPACWEMKVDQKKKFCCCFNLNLCYDTLPPCQEICNKKKTCDKSATNM